MERPNEWDFVAAGFYLVRRLKERARGVRVAIRVTKGNGSSGTPGTWQPGFELIEPAFMKVDAGPDPSFLSPPATKPLQLPLNRI